ncbi:MAG: DNA polymerase III subunit alpha [Silvanigrellales bacterium]|nr:DNA polymerase III subunit alpha [Silvanigrellales bacterium]
MTSVMAPEDFVHLHVHSEYSLLDGSMKVKKLVKELAARGAKAAALTDHDAMHGAVEYWSACKDAKLNGIVGYEANVTFLFGSRATNGGSNGVTGGGHSPAGKADAPLAHLVLLAANAQGYKNLIKLCTAANTTGKNVPFADATAVAWRELSEHAEGLICLTSCLKGELATHVAAGDDVSARAFLARLTEIFGTENVFVELIDNGIAEQARVVPLLATLAQSVGVGLVATADAHYLRPSDRESHFSLLAIKHKLQKTDVRGVDSGVQFHLATYEEMERKFGMWPEALLNTKRIADRCKLEIDTKSIFMPDYRQREDETADDCIVRLAREGLQERRPAIEKALKERFSDTLWKEYETRLEYELSVINKMKFAGYFLIVQDFINWAKNQNIPVGPGRGSAAGSLVTYALKITNIDPIRFNLLFERFLNPERISMPDIDTDFCQDRRGEVIEYVYQRYGRRSVAQIVTFGRLMAKNALKNLARILGWGFTDSNDFAKLIPEKPGITLAEALETEERLRERLDSDERAKTLWDGAIEIEGILNSLGVHAAGVIISDRNLDEIAPMQESEGQVVTQFENKYAEKVGLIKFDFLGLKTLTVIDRAVKLVHARHNPHFEIEEIELEDPKVYESISTAHVTGVFQLESNGMRKLIADLKPTCFNDIIAVLALFRPGPLGSGMVEDFVLRKHGKNPVEYLFPELEPILSDTYGVIVYQEQVQKIAAVLASYSLGEADLLRRAMGKKDKNEMERQKARFVEGATKNGHPPQKSGDLFDLMAKFAEYGFNKSHTAAYGWVTYQTAFLKTYFPTEFMTAIMTCDLDNTDKIVTYVRDCRRMGIVLRPPSVNSSRFEFGVPAEKIIQFGLGAVKGLGKGIIDEIVAERDARGPFLSVPEFIARVDARKLNKKVMESLVKAGAFDELASNRAEILENVDSWIRIVAKNLEQQDACGLGMFDMFSAEASEGSAGAFDAAHLRSSTFEPAQVNLTSASKPAAHPKGARVQPLRFDPDLRPTGLVPPSSAQANLLLGVQLKRATPWSFLKQLENEKTTLGFYMSGHPSDLFLADLSEITAAPLCEAVHFLDADDLNAKAAGAQQGRRPRRRTVRFAGLVTLALEKKKLQDGTKFGVYKLEDGTGELEITLYSEQYAALQRKFVVGECVWAECEVRPGIEDGSVRGIAKSIGLVSDMRRELLKRLVIVAEDSLLPCSRNGQALLEILSKHRGPCPVSLEVRYPSEGLRFVAELEGFGVTPSDELLSTLDAAWPGKLDLRRVYRATLAPSREPHRGEVLAPHSV